MSEQTWFVRRATGLVRSIGLLDAFIINFGWTGATFSISLAFMISQSLWAYPQSHFGIAQIITFVLVLLGSTIPYALLSIAMPRAGGDYVFNSRILHPMVGFVASFMMMTMLSFFVAWGAYWGGAQALASTLANLGYVMNVPGLVTVSEWLAGTVGAFIFSTVLIILFGVVVLAGIRAFIRLNQVLLVVGFLGLVIGLSLLAVSSRQQFVSNLNQFMSLFTTTPDYYNLVIQTAQENGYLSHGWTFAQTIAILPIVAFSSLFAVGTVYVGGEVRNVGRTQLIGMSLGLATLATLNALIYVLLLKVTGQEFLGAANYLWYEGTLPDLPLNPFFNLFILVLTKNPLFLVLVGLGYFAMSVLFVPMNIFLNTRMVFAWTFDRILPELFAQVHPRTHSPTYATLLVMAIAEIFLAIFAFTPWLSTLGAIAGTMLTFICTSLAAAIFPFRRPSLFRSSPIARYTIKGIPLISVCGAIGVIYLTATEVAYLVNDKYLVNSPSGLAIIGGLIIIAFLIYMIAQFVQRRRGVDFSMLAQEIPPE
jgi:amino acid transporter